MKASAGSTLLIVENRYPHDPRVRNEATALVAAGYQVTVISLRARDEASHAVFNGVEAYRIPRIDLFDKTKRSGQTLFGRAVTACKTLIGYVVEYSYFTVGSLFISLYVCARQRVDIIHLNNPPDTLCVIAALYKLLGKKIVFDHHDLSPELYLSRYAIRGEGKGLIYRTLLLLEKISGIPAARSASSPGRASSQANESWASRVPSRSAKAIRKGINRAPRPPRHSTAPGNPESPR